MGLVALQAGVECVNWQPHHGICKPQNVWNRCFHEAKPGGQSEATRYMISVLMFPAGLAWLALCWLVSRAFAKKQHWDGPKVVSTMGSFLQLGYTSLSSIALAPMTCFQHPNGLKSLLKYPGVICGSAEHDFMLVISWLTLLVFVVGFAVLCIYGVWKESQQRKSFWRLQHVEKNGIHGPWPYGPCPCHFRPFWGSGVECSGKEGPGARDPLSGLPLPLRPQLVVWSATVASRALDQPTCGLCHWPSANPGLHINIFKLVIER